MTGRAAPSIRQRLATALVAWAMLWALAVGAAVWLAATHEVDELLDDTLESSADLLAAIATRTDSSADAPLVTGQALERFAWQVVSADGRVLMRSPRAPTAPWLATARAGLSDDADWRLFGLALNGGDRMLYVAQTRTERREARMDVALGAVLAALAVGLLGYVWLGTRVRAELQPLQTLSDRLATLNFNATGADSLGPAARAELQPVHEALDALMARLAVRMANEQAFSAHAAHALRTPLAGIDAQLAVALREAPAPLAARLQRVREAAGRLQGVVAALLSLFRAGGTLQRGQVDLASLLARLPAAGLQIEVAPDALVYGDADLLAAAVANLLDNALRYGASQVRVATRGPSCLVISDNGPGVSAERRRQLQAALDSQAYEGQTGLGLMLADRVARSHGGSLHLPEVDEGFAVELTLAAAAAG